MTYKYDPDDKFGYKDTLPENHPEKVITGVEFDDEFKKIETGIGDLQVEIDAIVDGGSIDEAPANGLIYGRKDKSWVEVSEAGGAGIEEAPEDGSPYARKDKSWVKSVEADHTHDIDDVDGLDDALTDLAEKITAVTSDIVFGGTYDLANGVVLRSNKEFLIEGQPLPPAPDAPDVFLIVTSDGTFEGEALIRSDWIVSDGVTWIPIPYSSSGSLSWDNIVDKPAEFPPASHNHDGEYAPVDHNHDADYAPIDHNHDADYQPIGDYLTEAPDDGKPYVRQSKAWAEMPSTGGGGGSLWEQNLNDIYYDKGNVGIGISTPSSHLHVCNLSGSADVTIQAVGTSNTATTTYMGRDLSAVNTAWVLGTNEHDFTFSRDGTERMRIDADGNVGIGTDNPSTYDYRSSNLVVGGSGDAGLTIFGGATSHARLQFAPSGDTGLNNGLIDYDNNDDAMSFATGGSERMRIDRYGAMQLGGTTDAGFIDFNTVEVQIGTQRNPNTGAFVNTGRSHASISISGGAGGSHIGFGTASANNTVSRERVRIDSTGRVGIGGEPGTRTIDEAKALAKTKLTAWKAEVKKRTAEQPEASTQEITLEVTDGDFGVMPTEQALVDFLQERAIGGGDAKLQVAGDGYFSGQVQSGNGQIVRPSTNTGLFFNDQRFTPCTAATGSYLDATLDLGKTDARWKDGYFSDSVNVTGGALKARNNNITLTSDTIAGYLAIGGTEYYSWNANDFRPQLDAAYNLGDSDAQWKDGYFSGTIYGKVADVPDHVKAITPTQIANWDSGTGGGGGGATTDGRISDTQITHWDQAYGWGNHASAGYQPAGSYADSNHTHSQYLTSSSLNGYATESWVTSQGFAKGSFVPTSGNTTISGTLTATDFVASSDERLKDNISPMPVGLIDDIKPVQWTWKDSGKKSAGVIAQQLQEIGLDDFVTEGEDGMLGVNYNALVSVLLAEVISLKKELAK
jgi:hypothetical protein